MYVLEAYYLVRMVESLSSFKTTKKQTSLTDWCCCSALHTTEPTSHKMGRELNKHISFPCRRGTIFTYKLEFEGEYRRRQAGVPSICRTDRDLNSAGCHSLNLYVEVSEGLWFIPQIRTERECTNKSETFEHSGTA